MQNQDNYKPRDKIRNTLFNLQLQQQSGIAHKKIKEKQMANHQKYAESYDNQDQIVEIRQTFGQLQLNSNRVPNKHQMQDNLGISNIGQLRENSNIKKTNKQQHLALGESNWGELKIESSIQKNKNQVNKNLMKDEQKAELNGIQQFSYISKIQKKGRSVSRVDNKRKKQKSIQKKVEVDIEKEIGEVAEWIEKGTGQDSIDNFDDEKQMEENTNQQEIKKRLSDKIKGTNENKQIVPKGLKAKAQQLRLKNQRDKIKEKQQFSQNVLIKPLKEKNLIAEEQEQQDPWDKINQKTLKQKQKQQEIVKQLNYQNVVHHFQRIDIGDAQEEQDDSIQQDVGCLASICGCLTEKKPLYSMAEKQAIGLSKLQITNSEEQFYLLKNIWTNITHQKFNRYGGHWNQIGFQGRDPATDLRSTGVLSLLQWYIFVQEHSKFYQKVFKHSLEFQTPLALTHIKITSKYLQLTRKRVICSKNWEEIHFNYNCIVYGFFHEWLNTVIKEENIGEVVQKKLQTIQKSYKKLTKDYANWKNKQKIVEKQMNK